MLSDTRYGTISRALGLFVAAVAFVAVVLLAGSDARWLSTAMSIAWPAAELRVLRGSADLVDGHLIVRAPNRALSFAAALPAVKIKAADIDAVEIWISGLANTQKNVAVFWGRHITDTRYYVRAIDTVTSEGFRANLRHDPNWNGEITSLGFVIGGAIGEPVVIDSMRGLSSSALGLAIDTLRGWVHPEYWDGQSINVTYLGADKSPVSLPLFVAIATAIAFLAWVVYTRRRWPDALLMGTLTIAAAGWLLLDLRWIANLGAQVRETSRLYAGKTWHDKRLAADDRELFAFIDRVKEQVALRPGRVIFGSDFPSFRARAGYHLLPFNALSIIYHRNFHDPQYYHAGDYFCIFARDGIEYDPSTQMLSWDGKARLRAERVFVLNPGSLYRVLE